MACCFRDPLDLWALLGGREYNLQRTPGGYLPRGHEPFKNRPGVVEFPADTKVEFLTDVEGNWDYFVESITLSETLYWKGKDRGLWGPGELCLKDNCMFVFGGDAPDKGPGDIRVVKTLLSLKKRYPLRCFILLGNRDVNKLRFYAELDEKGKFLPYWNKPVTYDQYLEKTKSPACSLTTLKWMLEDMGCQTTFATRLRELAMLLGGAEETEALQSFRDSVDPAGRDPWMLSLMIVGHIAVVIGDNLFVHAGLPPEAIGRVPGDDHFHHDVREWVNKLNAWKDDCLNDYVARPSWRPGDGTGSCERLAQQCRRRGGDALIDYGVPGGNDGRTVMYHNPFVDGNPVLPSDEVTEYLRRSGIKVVLSGHQPHGQTPTVVRHPKTDLLCVTADTSYSDMKGKKGFNIANNRGDIINWVTLTINSVRIHGNSAQGEHDCKLMHDATDDAMPDALVGRQLTDGSWVKTVLKDDRDQVVAARGKGFQVAVHEHHYLKALFLLAPDFVTADLCVDMKSLVANVVQRQSSSIQYTCQTADEAKAKLWPEERGTHYFDRDEFYRHKTFIFDGNGTLFNCNLLQKPIHRNTASIIQLPSPSGAGTLELLKRGSSAGLDQRITDKVNFLMEEGKRVMFVTNSSSLSRAEYANKIRRHGIKLPPEKDATEVITSSFTCAWYLSGIGVKRPLVLTSATGLLVELRMMGITDYFATIHDDGTAKPEFLAPATDKNIVSIIKSNPEVDAVVVGWDHQLTALKIAVAAAYLRWSREVDQETEAKGAAMPVISCACDPRGVLGVTESDFLPESCWNNRSIPAVGNGTMAQAICSSVSDDCEAIDVGKPSQMMLQVMRTPAAQMGYGVDMSSAVVIGDTLDTDMEMAQRGAMKSLLVLSGVTTYEDLIDEDDICKIPTWLLPSLAEI